MFTVKAGYSNDVEIMSSVDKVRDFFLDIRNFAELMPGVQQVHTDAKGIAHWKVQTEIPLVGQILQKFALELSESTEHRVEWAPIRTEAENFLRYSADFLSKAKDVTLVHFSQMVELRRKSARDLHYLAGLAGETIISNEMSKRIGEMIRTFIDRAKERLEK